MNVIKKFPFVTDQNIVHGRRGACQPITGSAVPDNPGAHTQTHKRMPERPFLMNVFFENTLERECEYIENC